MSETPENRKITSRKDGQKPKKEKKDNKKKKSAAREWGETLAFALIVVPLINIFILQSYAIPTSSMEGSMLVGDKLFVSKFHYGPRIPQTPLALPFMHATIPTTNTKSYTELISLPYMRLPGFSNVEGGDIVVFNWPAGDTISQEYQSAVSYKRLKEELGGEAAVKNRFTLTTRPVDKRENYVKRCVAVGGDNLEIVDGKVMINGQPFNNNPNTQFKYIVTSKRGAFSEKSLREYGFIPASEKGLEYGRITTKNYPNHIGKDKPFDSSKTVYFMHMSEEIAAKLAQEEFVESVERRTYAKGEWDKNVFPYMPELPWNIENFGPLWIPKKGESIDLTNKQNYDIYKRAIKIYENNPTLKWNNGKAEIEGKPVDNYTFKMNYYWMMGDNRHNSQDSRMWGFVPEDHIVGTPIFVWLSTEKSEPIWNKIRWGKSFRTVD